VTPIEVMCGVDFTSSSMAALRAAVALVEGRRGRLNVVHAVDLSNRVAYSGGEARRVMRDYEALAAAAKQRILRLEPLQTLPRSQVNAVVVSGQAPRALLRVASDLEADLIAMGAPRRGMLAELLVGPTSRTVLRRATCPVLLATGEAACRRVVGQQVAEEGPPASRTAA
jgi:nucleotide-binding universal stress UspA family protein